MSRTFRRNADASPFADRREAFARGGKRATFEERATLRDLSARAVAFAALDDSDAPRRR